MSNKDPDLQQITPSSWKQPREFWRQWKPWIIASSTGLASISITAAIVWFSDWVSVSNYCWKRFLDADRCLLFGKTAWEWAELLVAPAILAFLGISINQYLKSRDNKQLQQEKDIADDRRKQEALKEYIEQMSQLLLDDAWPQEKGDSERGRRLLAVARARTLAVLRELDGQRKGDLVRFWSESSVTKFIPLETADLSRTELDRANLSGAKLYRANLSKVKLCWGDFKFANLESANLSKANLNDADLRFADLFDANLSGAVLHRANLSFVIFGRGNLSSANFRCANLSSIRVSRGNFSGTNLSSAILRDAEITSTDFTGADLSFADFSNADLRGSCFKKADLRFTKLSGACFSTASFSESILLGTDFNNAKGLEVEDLEGDQPPLLCGIRLPTDVADICLDRDCEKVMQILVEKYGYSQKDARRRIEWALYRQWD